MCSSDLLLLVGHSFGALVASTLAAPLEKMGRLAGLVLLSPSGLGEEVNRDFLLSVIEAADDEALARALEALTVKHYRSSAAYVRAMRARLLAAQAQLYRLVDDVVDIMGRQSRSIVETLANLSAPVTLVHGREDTVISTASRRLKKPKTKSSLSDRTQKTATASVDRKSVV